MAKVNEPFGGYIWRVVCGIIAVGMPILAIMTMLRGDIEGGLIIGGIGIPMFYFASKQGPKMTRGARNYRTYLRDNHYWLASAGVMTRLASILIIAGLTLVSIAVSDMVVWKQVAAGMFLMGWVSVVSTGISAFGANFISEPT